MRNGAQTLTARSPEGSEQSLHSEATDATAKKADQQRFFATGASKTLAVTGHQVKRDLNIQPN